MSNMTIHRIRLSKMQKIVNVLAVASSVVSLAVVGTGLYVYVQRDQLIDNIKSQALEAVLGGSCLLYTSPSPRDRRQYRMTCSA